MNEPKRMASPTPQSLAAAQRVRECRKAWDKAIAEAGRLHRERVKAGLAVDFDVVGA